MLAVSASSAQAAQPDSSTLKFNDTIKIERNCPLTFTAKQTEGFTFRVWRLIRWERGKPKPTTVRVYRKRLACAVGPGHRKAMKRRWRKSKRVYREHRKQKLAERAERRRLDALTAFGAWSIPEGIVMCESGGSFTARNAESTAGGAYQILDSTWAIYGGAPNGDSHPAAAAPPAEQHEVAARIWEDVGSSAWVCAG